MIFFVLALVVICLIGLRVRQDTASTLNKSDTTIINGIFVALIFLSHSTQYRAMSDSLIDVLYGKVQDAHNQWVVASFLAFSGFGVMRSLLAKGSAYLRRYPYNRLFKTLINFDLAVLLYLLMNGVLGLSYDGLTVAGSFIGLTAVGNSNWYIFTILLMYLATYVAARVFKEQQAAVALTVSVLCVLYVAIGHAVNLPARFYSTVCCYAAGLWLALYRDALIRLLSTHKMLSILVIAVPIVLTYRLRGNDYVMNVNSCFFVLAIVWFLTMFELRSSILRFLGKHAFSIYILQRLPMMALVRAFPTINRYVFTVASLGLTLLLAVAFDYFTAWFWKKIDTRRRAR